MIKNLSMWLYIAFIDVFTYRDLETSDIVFMIQ